MCQAKRKIKEEFSCFKINDFLLMPKRGRSSVGRAPPCQGGCRGFESLRPLHQNIVMISLYISLLHTIMSR